MSESAQTEAECSGIDVEVRQRGESLAVDLDGTGVLISAQQAYILYTKLRAALPKLALPFHPDSKP